MEIQDAWKIYRMGEFAVPVQVIALSHTSGTSIPSHIDLQAEKPIFRYLMERHRGRSVSMEYLQEAAGHLES